jgi:hypothetical protein
VGMRDIPWNPRTDPVGAHFHNSVKSGTSSPIGGTGNTSPFHNSVKSGTSFSRLLGGSRWSKPGTVCFNGEIELRRSTLQRHFQILTDGTARAPPAATWLGTQESTSWGYGAIPWNPGIGLVGMRGNSQPRPGPRNRLRGDTGQFPGTQESVSWGCGAIPIRPARKS